MEHDARSLGSEAFASKNYAAAVEHFTKALDSNPNDHLIWSNRAISHYELGKYDEAISDGQRCLIISPSYHKMYLCMGRAATAQKDLLRAEEFYREALSLDPGNVLYKQLVTQSTQAHISQYFAAHLTKVPMEIKWFNEERGKGFKSTRDLPPGVFLHRESPIISVRNVTNTMPEHCCSHCLRTQLVADDLVPYPEIASMIALSEPKWFHCDKCKERYCSETCRTTAWTNYHSVLCNSGSSDHPVSKLETLARSLKRTNPLLIARIFAQTMQRFVAGNAKHWSQAFEPFSIFVADVEPSPRDDIIIQLICEALQRAYPSVNVATYVTLHSYRRLNSAIIRNASYVHTVSDVHNALIAAHEKNAPRKDIYALIGCGEEASLETVLSTDFMLSLSIEGTALFTVANTFNHSCMPNTVLVSSYNCHDMRILSLAPVRQGEELLISYIDEAMPVKERQEKLKEMYQFTCDCKKCKAGS